MPKYQKRKTESKRNDRVDHKVFIKLLAIDTSCVQNQSMTLTRSVSMF